MKGPVMLINRCEVTWTCWEYLCMKAGADAFKTHRLLIHTERVYPDTDADFFRSEELLP